MLRDGAGGAGSAGQRGTGEGRGPEEKTHWWETRRGSSYTLHIMAALAEGQSRHSDGASDDWGRRGGTG